MLKRFQKVWVAIISGMALLCPFLSIASDSGLTLFSVTDGETQQEYSVKLQILLLMTALSFLPAFILMATSFTRIIVVLAILRQALGLQQSPPNRVLVGIALALTFLTVHYTHLTLPPKRAGCMQLGDRSQHTQREYSKQTTSKT